MIKVLAALFFSLSIGFTNATSPVVVSLKKDQQLAVYKLDETTGELTLKKTTPTNGGPASLALSPDGRFLYASLHKKEGSIAAFAIESDASLRLLNETPINLNPSYLSVHPDGKYLASSYFADGKAALHRIKADGSLAFEPSQLLETDERAHAAVWSPSGNALFVPHTRPNAIFQFSFDPAVGHLTLNAPSKLLRAKNTGPRHLWFHPSAPVAYGSDEQGCSLTSYRFDPAQSTLATSQTISSLPPEGFDGRKSTSDIEVHPNGRFVYIANRGHNSIATFAIDPERPEQLKLLGTTATEAVPRSFNISHDGRYLVAAGQKSGKLAVFKIQKDGSLTRTSTFHAGESPWWVQFLRPQ